MTLPTVFSSHDNCHFLPNAFNLVSVAALFRSALINKPVHRYASIRILIESLMRMPLGNIGMISSSRSQLVPWEFVTKAHWYSIWKFITRKISFNVYIKSNVKATTPGSDPKVIYVEYEYESNICRIWFSITSHTHVHYGI